MALFLKMKSTNESEIQESTSPCASHVHLQHSQKHKTRDTDKSIGSLTWENSGKNTLISIFFGIMDYGHAFQVEENTTNGKCN